MSEISRYEALLRICDMALAYATATHADTRPEIFEVLSVALSDDCPRQADAAASTARLMRTALQSRDQFLATLQPQPGETNLAQLLQSL